MTRVPALCSSRAPAGRLRPAAAGPSVDALSADPSRLHLLRAQCRAGQLDDASCAQVAQADLRRFLSGKTGPDEYQTLADLPPIPPSFDEPAEDSNGWPRPRLCRRTRHE
nr:hypothetical protein [Delftia sp.]